MSMGKCYIVTLENMYAKDKMLKTKCLLSTGLRKNQAKNDKSYIYIEMIIYFENKINKCTKMI